MQANSDGKRRRATTPGSSEPAVDWQATPACWSWSLGGRRRAFDRSLVMGIVNVTPDSFSDGGRHHHAGLAIDHGLRLLDEGADILDIGGESTRPGADPVDAVEEVRRVLPVIMGLRSRAGAGVLMSVDTCKAAVARAALDAGADMINDVTGLRGDAAMAPLLADRECGLVVMHMQGSPRTMQRAPEYGDVVAEVGGFFTERLQTLADRGIDPSRVVLDPGIGFGKTLEHNLQLLRALDVLRRGGRPLLIGVSRKSMIGTLLGGAPVDQRLWGTVALSAWLRARGAEVLRVHDVRPNVEAVRMMEAVLGARPASQPAERGGDPAP